MKKLIIAGALLLTLPGCVTTGGNVAETIKQVQDQARLICSFVPTVATVANIISAGSGDVLAIATSICSAITTAPQADGPGKHKSAVMVGSRRVTVRGKFVH